MTQTTNYQLNQWEATDQVQRVDFNADNAKIDAALAGLESGKAAASAVTALQAAVAQKADASALAALQTAVNGKGNCRIVTGTYTGTGTYGSRNRTKLTLGFCPKLLFIGYGTDLGIFVSGNGTARNVGCGRSLYVTWLDDGLEWYADDNTSQFVQLNIENMIYHYVALY